MKKTMKSSRQFIISLIQFERPVPLPLNFEFGPRGIWE